VSLSTVVVTDPVLTALPVPEFATVLSTHDVVARPENSFRMMRMAVAPPVDVTVIGMVPDGVFGNDHTSTIHPSPACVWLASRIQVKPGLVTVMGPPMLNLTAKTKVCPGPTLLMVQLAEATNEPTQDCSFTQAASTGVLHNAPNKTRTASKFFISPLV
jgi:hypothetical protein